MASTYPGTLDSLAKNKSDATAMATDHAAHHNDLADAVNKIEAELGTNPKGSSATVKARLDTLAPTASPVFTGNVGIGTSSPDTKLHLLGSSATVVKVSGDSGSSNAQFGHDSTGGFIYQGSDGKSFRISTGNAERFKIDVDGNITGTGSLGAWKSYTPTLARVSWAIGNGTTTGKYVQLGKIVHFWARATLGSTSTIGTGNPTLTLPVTATSDTVDLRYRVQFYDVSTTTRYFGAGVNDSTTTVLCLATGTNGAQVTVNATTPFTWNGADGDQIICAGTYEAA